MPAGLTASGSVGFLPPGGNSAAMSLAMDTSSAGTIGGSVTINYISDGTGSSGLGQTVLASQFVAVTGNVYTGQGVWNANGGGSWTDFSKWTASGGAPGIAGPLSAGDTALFGGAGRRFGGGNFRRRLAAHRQPLVQFLGKLHDRTR